MANRKENAYHSLAQMLEAGVHVVNALSTVSSGQSGRLRRAFRKLAQATSQGDSISEAMRRHRWTFTPLEVNIVEAGEKSGNLGFMVQQLADWYRFTNRMGRTVRTGLFLPVLMIIACGFLLPFISMIYSMINEGTTIRDYLAAVGRFFLPFCVPVAVVLGIIYLTPQRGPIRWLLDMVVIHIPGVGGAIKALGLSRYCRVFALTLDSGIPVHACSEIASDSALNAGVKRIFRRVPECTRQGQPASEGFGRGLPRQFIEIWKVGEETGDLDKSALKLADHYAETGENRLAALARWVPRLIYFMIMIFMAYIIVTLWSGYLSSITAGL